jgi:hypothetical protein
MSNEGTLRFQTSFSFDLTQLQLMDARGASSLSVKSSALSRVKTSSSVKIPGEEDSSNDVRVPEIVNDSFDGVDDDGGTDHHHHHVVPNNHEMANDRQLYPQPSTIGQLVIFKTIIAADGHAWLSLL